MTETERKALALVNEVMLSNWLPHEIERIPYFPALCRAIEQHEAFRQEVSDAVEHYRSSGFAAMIREEIKAGAWK